MSNYTGFSDYAPYDTTNQVNAVCFAVNNQNKPMVNQHPIPIRPLLNSVDQTTPSAPQPAPSYSDSVPAPWISSVLPSDNLPGPQRQSTQLIGATFPGGADMMVNASNAMDCQGLCIDDNKCNRWSYLPDATTNNCELKYGHPNRVVLVPRAISGQIFTAYRQSSPPAVY